MFVSSILGCICSVYFGRCISRWYSSYNKCHIYRLHLTNLSASSQCRTSSSDPSQRSQRDPALSSSSPVPALPGSDELASYSECVSPSNTCNTCVLCAQVFHSSQRLISASLAGNRLVKRARGRVWDRNSSWGRLCEQLICSCPGLRPAHVHGKQSQ